MNLLLESFREVQLTGDSEVCIVRGYAGAGKTYLVKKAMDRMVQEGALTTYAKYDQYSQDVPYLAMVNRNYSFGSNVQSLCISDIARQLFFKTIEDWHYFTNTMKTALGKDLPVLIELVPLLEKMFPKDENSHPKVEVPPSEAEERTLRIIQSFLSCVAFDDRPLVLFIDDIQWSSDAEINLLIRLISSFRRSASGGSIRNCLLIMSYRVNELRETALAKLRDVMESLIQNVGSETRGAVELEVGPLRLVNQSQGTILI